VAIATSSVTVVGNARRAMNYPINKTTVIDLSGGPLTTQPTCQILPPTMPGYQPYCPYTLHPSPGGAWTAPNLARAEQLVRASGTRGDKVTVPGGTWSGAASSGAAAARYIASVLDRLGYRASVRLFADAGTQLGWGWNSRNRPQISVYGWIEDYPAPYDFIGPLFTCASFVPDTWRNSNAAEFCDPRIDTQVRQALTVQAQGLAVAMPRWAAIDRELVNQAPLGAAVHLARPDRPGHTHGQLPVPPSMEPTHRPAVGPVAPISPTRRQIPSPDPGPHRRHHGMHY